MTYEEMFIRSFVNKSRQDRILFELLSKNNVKRNNGLYKLTNYLNSINFKYIIEDISHLEDNEAIKVIKKHIQEKNGYSIISKEIKPIEEAYLSSVNRYIVDVIVINENIAIYIGEIYSNFDGKTASPKFILKRSAAL